MTSAAQSTLVRPVSLPAGFRKFVDKYFYLAMALLFPVIIVAGFSRTVDHSLFHASPPRPLLLWIHGAVFSAWLVFFLLQSLLVRTRNVKWHRFFGWFGATLGVGMVVLGFAITVVMDRFDAHVLHQPFEAFMSIQLFDMAAFGTLFALAIAWRKRPELHRRLLFIATCGLLDAAFGRFDYIFNHNLYYACLDGVILLGVARDLVVNRRIHSVYRYALPSLVVAQSLTLYLWILQPGWWLHFTRAVID